MPLDAHHPEIGRHSQRKAPDGWAVPLRRDYHVNAFPGGLHHGEREFWNRHGIDPEALALDLRRAYEQGRNVWHARRLIQMHREAATTRRTLGLLIYP